MMLVKKENTNYNPNLPESQENAQHIEVKDHQGVHRIYDLKTLFGDHFLWHVGKERPTILVQFAISSLIIAGRLTGDKLSWRRTKFKIVAYISHLFRSNNDRYSSLGDEIRGLISV